MEKIIEEMLEHAKELLELGGQVNTDEACVILTSLVQKDRLITLSQSMEALILLSDFLELKTAEINMNIENLQLGLKGKDLVNIARSMSYLAANCGYLSDEQKRIVKPLKVELLRSINVEVAEAV